MLPYPEGFTMLVEECWRLDRREAQTLWTALLHSRWSRAVQFRQSLMLVGHVRTTQDLLARVCRPDVLWSVLADLTREGVLQRHQCARLEEALLSQVQASGRWKGDPAPPGAVRPCGRAADISILATVGQA